MIALSYSLPKPRNHATRSKCRSRSGEYMVARGAGCAVARLQRGHALSNASVLLQ